MFNITDELKIMMGVDYDTLCSILKVKYGLVNGSYFLDEKCSSKNNKIGRTKDGLFIHHIDEDKAIMLSNPIFARRNPYSYQKSEHLVYCNYLEHLLLHIKIVEKTKGRPTADLEILGVGGMTHFIIPELNDIYFGKFYFKKDSWRYNVASKIKNRFDDYRELLRCAYKLCHKYFRMEIEDFCTSAIGKFKAKDEIGKLYYEYDIKKML